MPTINSFIRFLNVSIGCPAVDIYLDEQLVFTNIAYNELSDYLVVGPEQAHIQLFPVGAETDPLLDTQLDIPSSSTITIAIIGIMPDISLMPIFFAVEPIQNSSALIRFAHLSPTAPAMDLAVTDGQILFTDVQYMQVTDFQTLSPGDYNLQLQDNGKNQIYAVAELQAAERQAYTFYATGDLDGEPVLGLFYYQDQIPFFGDLAKKAEFSRDTTLTNNAPKINIRYR